MTIAATGLFLVLLIGFPIWDVIETPRLRATSDVEARTRYYGRIMLVEWIVTAIAVLLYGPRLFSITLAPRPGWLPEQGAVLGFAAALAVAQIVPIAIMAVRTPERTPFASQIAAIDYLLPKTERQRVPFVLVSITAGVCEETVFRGFVIAYLLQLPLGVPVWLALTLSSVLFGVIHAGQGIGGVIGTAILGLIFGGVFLAFGGLWPAIVLHVIADARFALLRPR